MFNIGNNNWSTPSQETCVLTFSLFLFLFLFYVQ